MRGTCGQSRKEADANDAGVALSSLAVGRSSVLIGDHLSVCAVELCYVLLRELPLTY